MAYGVAYLKKERQRDRESERERQKEREKVKYVFGRVCDAEISLPVSAESDGSGQPLWRPVM